MGSFSDVFNEINKLNDEYVDIWEDICNIESPTKYKAGVDAVGNYVADMARERGWRVEKFPQPVSGDVVVITMNPDSAGSPVSLSAHMDTVHPLGSFGTPAVRRDAENIYGPGVTDCKGGIVAALLAMDALYKTGFNSRPVMLLLQSDEEGGSRSSNKETIKHICEKAKDSVCFLNLEGNEGEYACIFRKGIASFHFTVTGAAAHASRCAIDGANAIAEAASKILELEKIKDNNGLTCCCSLISGGTALNTVPENCQFDVNVRYATNEQLEWINKYVKELADETFVPGCRTAVESIGWRYSMELNERNVKLLDRINEIWKDNGLSEYKPSSGTGGSDAADVTVAGIPCVDCLGVFGAEIHSQNEYARISSLSEMAKRIAAVTFFI